MKKILLLILTSLILFAGCKKEDPEQVADGLGRAVTQEYTCECGAKYSVTCKRPDIRGVVAGFDGGQAIWVYVTDPSRGAWKVEDEAGENVPHYEETSIYKMYFNCICGKNSREFTIEEFQTQEATLQLP